MGAYSWVRGVVPQNDGIPTISQMQALGLHEIMPFGWQGNVTAIRTLADNGIKVIPNSSQLGALEIDINPAFEAEYNIMAYFVMDEPEFNFTADVMISRINTLRSQTSLPITINFTNVFYLNEPWMADNWGDRYAEVFALLDFICIDVYFFRGGGILQIEIDRTETAYARAADEGKEIAIALAQGHEFTTLDITTPDIAWTDNFWRSRGSGVLWYAWNGFTYSLGTRGGAQNEYYNTEIALVNLGFVSPTAPSNCTSHYIATDNAKCTWTDNSNNETGFRIERAIAGAGWVFWKNVGAGVTDSGTFTLGSNNRIKFRVRAYNGFGDSAYSTSAYIYTTPVAPSGITLSWLVQDETVRITWADNSVYEQDFDIERDTDDVGFAHIVYDVASPYDDEEPSGFHKYKYRVRARCPGERLSSWNTSDYIISTGKKAQAIYIP